MDPAAHLDFSSCTTTQEGLQKIQDQLPTDVPLLQRRFLNVDGKEHGGKHTGSICVMQWNVLAQGLTGGESNFIRCPKEVLFWERRRLKLLQQILCIEPDILCLQEVDHFEFFHSTLKNFGYEGLYKPKQDSPCLRMPNNNGPDGCAIMYKVSEFDLLDSNLSYLDEDTGNPKRGCVILQLKHKPSEKRFYVATTHLKAKEGFEEIRLKDGIKLLEKLEKSNLPVIVCGDFNASPTEPVIQAFKDSSLKLKNVYECATDIPQYTTWKIRGTEAKDEKVEHEVCKNIDYIWCSADRVDISALLSIPSEAEIGKDRLPCPSYPSDHFAIAALMYLTQ